ncbi:MAG: 4Fe-4S ferredoxin [Gammaproteobacteria bacterium]|nr:MAG: 4Fe-4S ferredoxin [Gammaproteobacteria bacterium]
MLKTKTTKYQNLVKSLALLIDKSRLITDPSLCYTLGTDASLYRMTPEVIVKVDSIDELKKVMQLCSQFSTPYTFRAAGTSLSGQAVSDSVLIMLTENWINYKILESGNKIRLQPGIIGADVNRYLAPFHKKIGPDPASLESCKIGGIAANNSSGMCCGTAANSYQTLSSMTVVLVDGSVLNTLDIISVEKFKNSHGSLLRQLSALADETKSDASLKQLIQHKYRLKNTMGFSINALIDFDDPIEILQHLMIGSEGCLGFIADITYKTVTESQFKATALYVFADIKSSCQAVSELAQLNVAAVELIDGRALQSISGKSGLPEFIKNLDLEATALLLECHATSKEELNLLTKQVTDKLTLFHPIEFIRFTGNLKVCANLWQIRKGLLPAVGGIRKTGTSIIIEDIAFPISNLAAGTMALRTLLNEQGYSDAIIFGHALVGNLHFVITNDFSNPEEVEQYKRFMEELSELVAVKFKGSLKAEHGTGRNMAPFVELEWGSVAYSLMQKIKMLFDPEGILNPGVIINPERECHINNLKTLPVVEPLIDKCIECGFCEAVCPSKNLSLTPRQRIVMFRQLQQLKTGNQTSSTKRQIKLLTKKFNYLGIDTCAATGLCEDRCPVGINTGDLIRLLKQPDGSTKNRLANWSANHFAFTTMIVRMLFKINQLLHKLLPDKGINVIGQSLHRLSNKSFPLWFAEYPTASKITRLPTRSPSKIAEKKVVYIPSCASRTLGTQTSAKDQRSLPDVTINLLEKAGYQVIIPREMNQLCCGMPYHNHGINTVAKQKSKQFESLVWHASEMGEFPILIDASACKQYSAESFKQQMAIYEPFEFAEKYLLDELQLDSLDETIMLHITCSSRRMKLTESIINIAKLCSNKVVIADDIECCGWAGNKGFTTPELNKSALSPLRKQIPAECKRGFSNSLTCEIGLSHHGGIPYQSIFYLLDEVSSAKSR